MIFEIRRGVCVNHRTYLKVEIKEKYSWVKIKLDMEYEKKWKKLCFDIDFDEKNHFDEIEVIQNSGN